MRILAISEHFFPRIGGTTHYVDETCRALVRHGADVHLIVPGLRSVDESLRNDGYNVTRLGVGYPERGDPTRNQRYEFCDQAARLAESLAAEQQVDVVHVLFGLFLMERLNTAALRESGVPSVATVHNVPPLECSRSWEGDEWRSRLKDAVRLKFVSWKNKHRLRRHAFTHYVAPSSQVRDELAKVLPSASVSVEAHGVSDDLLSQIPARSSRSVCDREHLQLLTLGGWVPHKRQHLIPAIADYLRSYGLEFRWRVAGPAGRICGYKAAIDVELQKRGLQDIVHTSDAVPADQLPQLYETADLYIQPSTEEGFCLTALDAAGAGLPVIGSPAGALPEICAVSNGRLVESQVSSIAEAILDVAAKLPERTHANGDHVSQAFTWARASCSLLRTYASLRKQ